MNLEMNDNARGEQLISREWIIQYFWACGTILAMINSRRVANDCWKFYKMSCYIIISSKKVATNWFESLSNDFTSFC